MACFLLLYVGEVLVLAYFPYFEPIVVEPFGEADVSLYVVALDGVGGRCFGDIIDVSRTVKGVVAASSTTYTTQYVSDHPSGNIVYGKVEINTSVIMINDWLSYEEVVKTCSGAILVNAHGEVLPVPRGYTKEEWVDKIAEAMLYRNVTWVHTAGYPLYYYYLEGDGEYEWGEEGFKTLMSHIGKGNATCWPPGSETEQVLLNTGIEYGLEGGWDVECAYLAERGRPLQAAEFKDCLSQAIWGDEDYYMTGAIIKFAKANQTGSFGFYIHIGTRKTFASGDGETDGDYHRGYIGAAAAIWVCAMRSAVEDAITEAEKAISKAEAEGRTKGLDYAKQLLQEAKSRNRIPWVAAAIQKAREAKEAAENAVKPSFLEVHMLPLAILGLLTAATITGLAVKRRNNLKQRKDERE